MPLEETSTVVPDLSAKLGAGGPKPAKRSVSAKSGATAGKRRQSAPKRAVTPASAPKSARIEQHPASMSHVQVTHGHKCRARDIGHSACLAKGCKVCAHLAG